MADSSAASHSDLVPACTCQKSPSQPVPAPDAPPTSHHAPPALRVICLRALSPAPPHSPPHHCESESAPPFRPSRECPAGGRFESATPHTKPENGTAS